MVSQHNVAKHSMRENSKKNFYSKFLNLDQKSNAFLDSPRIVDIIEKKNFEKIFNTHR